jgi:hypothetical protein
MQIFISISSLLVSNISLSGAENVKVPRDSAMSRFYCVIGLNLLRVIYA